MKTEDGFLFSIDEDGNVSEYNEPYAIVEFKTEEDFTNFKEMIEKSKAKKPTEDEVSKIMYVKTYTCPNCGGGVSGKISNYCYHCGQKFKWED